MSIARLEGYPLRYMVACDRCGCLAEVDCTGHSELTALLAEPDHHRDVDLWFVQTVLRKCGWKLQCFHFVVEEPVLRMKNVMRQECPRCVAGLPTPAPAGHSTGITFGVADPNAAPDIVSKQVLSPPQAGETKANQAACDAPARRRRALEQAAQRLFRNRNG